MDAVALMTHEDDVPYLDYVAKLKGNPIAREVKLADLAHNSDQSRLGEIDEETLLRLGAEILASLGQQDQSLYRMHYKLHMKYADIAAVLGVSESTVQVRAFRLRARVLQKIHETLGGKEDAVCGQTILTK